MSDVVLATTGLGKLYRIGGEQASYRTLRDALVQAARRPVERLRHPGAATHVSRELWALKDVNLQVQRGEVLGIIGRNGAGKSTLLKVLSHITDPTEGRVEIRGRVGSLLEIGTGFHDELTGRENIYLSGAILGMSRAQIRQKFDEMVAFSELSGFLDTPVKRYSSGMYIRLAFAVAAHLETEIMIVDEVLAVGDASFQKKCLGKMEDVAGHGRTVLFVSHNMQAVRALCTAAIELDAGHVLNRGETAEVVAGYLTKQASTKASVDWPAGAGPGDVDMRLAGVQVFDANGDVSGVIFSDQPFRVRITFDLSRADPAWGVGFDLVTGDGAVLFRTHQTDDDEQAWPELRTGRNSLDCLVPADLLNDGLYTVMPRLVRHRDRVVLQGVAGPTFEVHRVPRQTPYTQRTRVGVIAPVLRWSNAGTEPGPLTTG